MIIPSIDILDGRAVQLVQGDPSKKMVEIDDPIALAKKWRIYGDLAVIDLDAALGKGENTALIKTLCKLANCRVGGGIRTLEKANEFLAAGAKKIIIGTKASKEFLSQLPRDRIIVAVDTKKGKVTKKGWTEQTQKTAQEIIDELEDYCAGFLYTIVDKEGLMQGPDMDAIKKIAKSTSNKIIAAGGITSTKDIVSLENEGIDSQVGMALYTDKIKLEDTFISLLDFGKNKDAEGVEVIPTIVQDTNRNILMLAFSTQESLKKALTTQRGIYYSRSRRKIWRKGETSGCTQELLNVRYDCDRDTLLFSVKQKGNTCHEGKFSCFNNFQKGIDKEFDLATLYDVIEGRLRNSSTSSYTAKIIKDKGKINKKIAEEAQEVITAPNKDNLIWEIADLLYFVLVLMVNQKITLNDVKNELWRRRK